MSESGFAGRWFFRISGDLEMLMEIEDSLEAIGLYRFKENGEWLWTSPRFEPLTEAHDVLVCAKELISVVRGAIYLTFGSADPIAVNGILRAQRQKPPVQFIFPDSAVAQARAGMPTIARESDAHSGKEEKLIYKFLAAAEESESMKRVFRLVGSKPLDWSNLYRIFEIVSADVDVKISVRGWASESDIRLFKHTANHPAAVGDEARHGVMPAEPPSEPMKLAEAEVLIRNIVESWIRGKMQKLVDGSPNPGIKSNENF